MGNIKSVLKSTSNVVEALEEAVCSIVLVAVTLLMFVQVVNRYCLHLEIMWVSNVALYCFIFLMFLAAASATWRRGHVAVDYFHERAFKNKPRGRAIHRLFLSAVSVGILCTFLPAAFKFMLRAAKYPEYDTLVRWFNSSWLQMFLFVALVLILMHLLTIAQIDVGDVIKNCYSRSKR